MIKVGQTAGAKMKPDDPDNEDSVNRLVASHKRAESGPNSFAQAQAQGPGRPSCVSAARVFEF